MFLKILILVVFLVAFSMLALGVKLLFNKEATSAGHTCAAKNEKLNNIGGCASCGIKELENCSEEVK